MTGRATILRADARSLPLPDESVDLIVTSPPYFALRSYQDGGEHYGEQIGAEPTPREYIAALIDCTREWMRVLKPSGSIWVNLGDKYSQRVALRRSSHQDGLFPDREDLAKDWKRDRAAGLARMPYENVTDVGSGRYVPEKSLMLLPERYRIAAVDELGLTARAVVIWSKPNGLPEPVTDRVRRSHEDWVHLTKLPRYYSAIDEIRETSDPRNLRPADLRGAVSAKDAARRDAGHGTIGHVGKALAFNPLGKLPGSVWTIATEPLKVPAELGIDHFAAFPTEWPRRIILGWSPSGICIECGEGRRPVSDKRPTSTQHSSESRSSMSRGTADLRGVNRKDLEVIVRTYDVTITGEACACSEPTAPTRPSVVLDPFGGTGTTALVAKALGRHGISGDRSADYCRLARWRTTDPGQLAKAMRVVAPAKELDGQASLLDLFGSEMAS